LGFKVTTQTVDQHINTETNRKLKNPVKSNKTAQNNSIQHNITVKSAQYFRPWPKQNDLKQPPGCSKPMKVNMPHPAAGHPKG